MALCTSLQVELIGVASGRIGDYSPDAALFIGAYQKTDEHFKRISVYSMIDEGNRDNAPNPRFTISGGPSFTILNHLRYIFNKNTKVGVNARRLEYVDESGNRLVLNSSRNSDFTIGTEDGDFEPGAVVSFKEDHPLYQDLFLFCVLIDSVNLKNPERNPFNNEVFCKRLKSRTLFP